MADQRLTIWTLLCSPARARRTKRLWRQTLQHLQHQVHGGDVLQGVQAELQTGAEVDHGDVCYRQKLPRMLPHNNVLIVLFVTANQIYAVFAGRLAEHPSNVM